MQSHCAFFYAFHSNNTINEIKQDNIIELFCRCGQEQRFLQTGQIQMLQTGGTNLHSRITAAFQLMASGLFAAFSKSLLN